MDMTNRLSMGRVGETSVRRIEWVNKYKIYQPYG